MSLAAFGVGFLTRPIGAIVIGLWADRAGRKPAMIFSFATMGIGLVGLCLTPTYARIGMAAPVLVIFFRLLQGFALGGNVRPATAYMVEAAPAMRRGFYASMQAASQDVAVLIAGIIATTLASILSDQQLQDWGWRVTMLAGAAIVPFGLVLRRNLPETLNAPEIAIAQPSGVRPYVVLIFCALLILAAGTIGNYTINYMTTYALTTLHLSAKVAFGLIIVTGLLAVISDVTSGLLSDRFGRRPVMIIPGPDASVDPRRRSMLIGASHSTARVLRGARLAFSSCSILLKPGPLLDYALTETLPRTVRAGAISMVYAFAIAAFGGSTQFTIQLLLNHTKSRTDTGLVLEHWGRGDRIASRCSSSADPRRSKSA